MGRRKHARAIPISRQAYEEKVRLELEAAAQKGMFLLSVLKVGDTFEWIGEAEWYGDGRKAVRHTITEITPFDHGRRYYLALQPDNCNYICVPTGITDRLVRLIPPGDNE